MAMKCAWCRSLSTQAAVRNFQCLTCGRETGFDGEKVDPLVRPPR